MFCYYMISMDDGSFVLFCCLLASKLRLMLESLPVLFQFGFSNAFCALHFEFRFGAVQLYSFCLQDSN